MKCPTVQPKEGASMTQAASFSGVVTPGVKCLLTHIHMVGSAQHRMSYYRNK